MALLNKGGMRPAAPGSVADRGGIGQLARAGSRRNVAAARNLFGSGRQMAGKRIGAGLLAAPLAQPRPSSLVR